jgi:type IV pilus assembly protein PilN
MIRINLLPVRALKKKETAKQQIFILVFSVGIVLAIGIAVFTVLQTKIITAKKEIERSEAELKQLKAKIGEIENIKKLQDEVKKKLDVLNQLRRDKAGPANRLAKLSESIPDKLWLTKYSESGNNVSLGGIAYNEELIAEFMRNLAATGNFTNVELLVSQQTEISGVKAKQFDLSCQIKSSKTEEPPKPAKK